MECMSPHGTQTFGGAGWLRVLEGGVGGAGWLRVVEGGRGGGAGWLRVLVGVLGGWREGWVKTV